jgi:hypothetical protein
MGLEQVELPSWWRVGAIALPARSAALVGGGIGVGLAVFLVSARLFAKRELGELTALIRGRTAR